MSHAHRYQTEEFRILAEFAYDRLNSIVFGGFAIVALAIAVVGVSGVLAFSVSARTREFGIRLAVGSQPSRLLTGVIREPFNQRQTEDWLLRRVIQHAKFE